MSRNNIITGLDLGTKTIKVLVVGEAASSKSDGEKLEVLESVEIPSFGIRRGVVVNIDEVSKKITEVFLGIQQQIGGKIDNAYVNVSGSHLYSVSSRGTVVVSRADQKISKEDINRAIQAAQAFSLPSNKEIFDVYPQEFIVDGQGQIKEPLDMQGLRLEVEALALCGFSPYIKNLTSAVLGGNVQISDIIPSPLASAKAVLTPRQKELGVCVVDMGAGTTSIAVYEEGNLVHVAVFPVGSEHITNDIAVCLKTDVDIAEKIKQEFGVCSSVGGKKNTNRKQDRVEVSKVFEGGEPLVFSRKILTKVIEARVSEIFNLIQKELKQVKLGGQLPAGVVLTGGGAKLPKMTELAKKELKLPCRLGYALGLSGLEKNLTWSTVAGLVMYGISEKESHYGLSSGKEIFSKIKKVFKVFIP